MTTVQSRLRVALGTFVAIEAEAASETQALQGIDAAFDALLAVQELMHPVRGSDLGALAHSPLRTPLKVHAWTHEVLELCKRLHSASQGIFDPCLAEGGGRLADLQLLPDDMLIVRVPMQVDLGGIAKGYAVDRAIDALRASGCTGGLVNAGGDLAVFGQRRHRIVCGSSGGLAALVELHEAALATSDASTTGPQDAPRPTEHRGYYDGRAVSARVSGRSTVIAARAAIADGLTKCLLTAGQALTDALLHTFGARQIQLPQMAGSTNL